MQGPESHYRLGEDVARTIFAPVMRSHRVTVEQMAILEPVLILFLVLLVGFIGVATILPLLEAADEV